jgi:NADPH:quinone reductase-like Zn-dependent oxidoreductase
LQTGIAQELSLDLGIPKPVSDSLDLESMDVSSPEYERQDYILLNGLDENLLWDLQPSFLHKLQKVVATGRKVLWVTGGGGKHPSSPKFGIANGLIRVIRQEDNKVNITTLSLDNSPSHEAISDDKLGFIRAAFQSQDAESEYLEMENRLCINRLVTARAVDEHIFSKLENPVIHQEIGEKQLRLGVRVPGLLDTMEFTEEDTLSTPLGPYELIIQVKALGVNFKDCLTVLGRVDSDIMGSECAGIIREVGIKCEDEFKPGDRVVAAALDSYKTFVRIEKHTVQKIPDGMTFVEAATFPTAFCTALYSLVNIARLQKGESILIHAASGGTGQAAVQMALRLGAEVFATVGSSSKKQLLMDRYGLAEDHIFYSRNTSFADGIKRVTKGRGVDVVLNSVSGRLLEASWDSVAPFGRFVEIGRKDVDTRGYLPMYPFIKNLSFSGVDLTMVLQRNIKVGQQLLTEVMSLADKGEIRPVYPIHPHNVADVERAFRFMQSGKSSGKIVLELENEHVVPVSERLSKCIFRRRSLISSFLDCCVFEARLCPSGKCHIPSCGRVRWHRKANSKLACRKGCETCDITIAIWLRPE